MNRPALTLTSLDQDLAYWQATHARIQANLFELYEHPTYQRLKGDSTHPAAPLTGDSAKQLPGAVKTVSELLQLTVELSSVVERARELRAAMPMVFRADPMQKIDSLLHGRSVATGAMLNPLETRGLLGRAVMEKNLSPRELLDIMMPAYEKSRNTILQVDKVWNKLPEVISSFEQQLTDIVRRADELGEPTRELGARCKAMIRDARESLLTDPLTIATDLESTFEQLLSAAETRLQQRVAQRTAIETRSTELVAALERLNVLEADIRALAEECVSKTDSPIPPVPERAGELAPQLAQLRDAVKAGHWRSAEPEVKRLGAEIQDHERQLDSLKRVCKASMDFRLELRGRLEALQVKAQARGLSEDAALANLARAARDLLFSRPTPMAKAQELVVTYQRQLDALIRK